MASELCHHQNHLPDRLRGDGCGADDRAWMMSSRELPTTMYRSWVWCAECSSLDVCGTLWTNLLPRTKNKATIEVFAGQPNEESDWETTTYCPSTRLVSRSRFRKNAPARGRFFVCRDAGCCSRHSRATASSWKAWYQCACGEIPTSVSQSEWRVASVVGTAGRVSRGMGSGKAQWLGMCTSVLRVARAERLAKGQHQRCLNRTRVVTFFGPILHVRSTIAR